MKLMSQNNIILATDQRKFILVYHDFYESHLLNHYEKAVFIALKKYSDNDTQTAFPSISTLQTITGISRSQIKRCLEHMEKLGVISVQRRTTEKGHQNNLYTLHDYADVWKVDTGNNEEQISERVKEIVEMNLIKQLQERGYIVTKEKGLVSEPTTAHSQAPISNNNNSDVNKSITKASKSQTERYTMQDIQDLFEYDYLILRNPSRQTDIDVVFHILYDILNTTRPTIRVGSEDKPTMIVIGRLMKLQPDDLLFAIDTYHEQTSRIKNVKSYLLTLLYHARDQSHLDLMNLGHYNGDF